MRSVLELIDEYLDQGRLHVDPGKNPERVTLHDPCNLVRWGGVIEAQRRVLSRVAADFVEMTPNRVHNYCCGGGGGCSRRASRQAAGEAESSKPTRSAPPERRVVATPCHNCIDQLIEISEHYKLGVEIRTVAEIVYDALVLVRSAASPP